jgi:hypothetical protein
MPRRVVPLAFVLACIVTSAGPLAQADEFAAQLVSSEADGKIVSAPGRIYVAGHKVRIETPEFPDSFLIVDTAVPDAYLVRPAQRIFMESKQSTRLTRLFVPLDPADPCRQWQVMAEVAGISDSGHWRCIAKGSETVDGRSTLKFGVTSLRGHGAAWIDAGLKFPVKIAIEDGAVLTLKDIEEAPQPVEKFEIPASYGKFDPRGVIEQMKRSDIWVEPQPAPDAGVR